jgi:biopolymer transport protein ExbB
MQVLEYARDLWSRALVVWEAGGWCMPPIALTACLMFGLGVHVFLRYRAKGFTSIREATWRHWVTHRSARVGHVGRLIDHVTAGRSIAHVEQAFQEVRAVELAPFERDLRVMKVCIGAAPLLGLLGTVTGMLATFDALANGSGGEKTMGMIAKGISEALITTETGLVVALPGVFFLYQLQRTHDRYRAFLAHLETACTQQIYKTLRRAPAA